MIKTLSILEAALIFLTAGLLASCRSASSAKGRATVAEQHIPRVPAGDDSMRGTVVHIEMIRSHSDAPIEHRVISLAQVLKKEITARGGMVVDEPGSQALHLRITVSRYLSDYLTAMPRASRHRTYLDFTVRIDHPEGRSLPSEGVRSIQGTGNSSINSHLGVLRRFVDITLEEPRFQAFLAAHRVSTEGLLRIRLASLAEQLEQQARLNLTDRQVAIPMRLGLAPLRGDQNNRVSAQLLPELMQLFKAPDFQFFTRTQLENIMEEQALQMTDLVDPRSTTARAGQLQGVDYLVTGLVDQSSSQLAVQLELVSITTGEVLAAAAVAIQK